MGTKAIWKYAVPITDEFEIEMPQGARVLAFQIQEYSNEPCIWALVDPEAERFNRKFRLIGTGHPIQPPLGRHIGTVQMADGRLIWHLFEPVGIH